MNTDWRKPGDDSSFSLTPDEGVVAEVKAGSSWFVSAALLCLSLPISAAAIGDAAHSADVVRFDIPRQRADQALIAFAEQANVTFIFPVEKARRVTANEIRGEFSSEEAIRKLLDGTGLHPRFQENGALAVSASSGVAEKGDTVVAKRGLLASMIAILAGGAALDAKSDQEAETPSTSQLNEVLVTAQRRTERLQDVPVSISVVTADDISRRLLVGAEDYLRGIPGVSHGGRLLGQSIVIRGIETTLAYQGWATGTTTGAYFGEVPTTGSAGGIAANIDIKLVDIERVEVLKGPQGTSFGSSAMGGVVRTIAVQPDLHDYEGKLGAGYSSTADTGGPNYMFEAVGNVPVVEGKFALRGVAYSFLDTGFYRSRAASDADFREDWLTPYSSVSDEEEVGTTYVTGVRLAALLQATDDLRFTFTYLSQDSETDGTAVANSGTYEQTILHVAPEHVRRSQMGGFLDTEVDIANLVMEYDFGWADLLATYSYLEGGSRNANNYSAWFYIPFSESILSEQQAHVGEVRLATKFGGSWEFLAGLYAEDVDDDFWGSYYWTSDPATSFIPGQLNLGGLLPDRRTLKQRAAFGEVSWELAPRLTLTGGVRAYDYERTARITNEGIFGEGVVDIEGDADGTTYRGNLSFRPSDDSLLYGGWSQGFRLGKPQPGLPPSLCDEDGDGIVDGTDNVTIESTRTVNSDEVDNYEIGGKFAFLDRRFELDAAVFRMDWSNIPFTLNAPAAPEGCALTYVANAGEAKSEGIEFQARFQITDALRLDFGGSKIDAKLTEDAPAAGLFAGAKLPSPEMNGNLGLHYAFDWSGHEAFVRTDVLYVGKIYESLAEQGPNTQAGDYVKLDASARIRFGDMNFDFYIHNLTNEDAFTARSGVAGLSGGEFYGYRLRPRTIGVQLGYEF